MHMHITPFGMRTTIELSEAHRAILLRLSAARGQKGFSRVVADAIDAYVGSLGLEDERVAALRLRGVLLAGDAAELEARTRSIRESWR